MGSSADLRQECGRVLPGSIHWQDNVIVFFLLLRAPVAGWWRPCAQTSPFRARSPLALSLSLTHTVLSHTLSDTHTHTHWQDNALPATGQLTVLDAGSGIPNMFTGVG